MPQRRQVARAALTAAAATACLAFAAPAWASAASLPQFAPGGNNPAGDNGTVKIDGLPFSEDDVRNEPHVSCDFQLQFFNLDEGQRANVSLTAQPPSGTKEVWSKDDVLLSNDPASGAANDHDEVITLSADDLDLTGLKLQDQQGYHIKLNVDLTDGNSFDDKHKVFWIQPCETTPTTPPGTPPPTTTPGTPPTTTPGAGGVGGSEGGLPLTGVGATSIALGGLTLIGGGVALMVLRRRRDNITFTS